jgi:hypothetical protein
MPISTSTTSSRAVSLWPWVAGFLPGVMLLIMLWPLRVPIPHLDGWAFVQQYQRMVEGGMDWNEFLAPHYIHPSAVGKGIYFAVLHWMDGNLGLLPLIMWLVAAVIMACVCHLARSLWTGSPLWGGVLMFLAGLTVFSAAQGEVWIWGFLFQNSIPGVCLTLGLVLLCGAPLSAWRLSLAAVLNVVAIFSFGSGLLVGLLLAIPLWYGMAGRTAAQRWGTVGGWLMFTALVGWFSLRTLGSNEPISAGVLIDRPFMRLHFILVVLGLMLGKGTVFEPAVLCALLGAILLLLFVFCLVHVFRHRRDRDLVSAALPWMVCGFYGLGTAALICVARSFNSVSNALEERYAALTLFFVLGTLLLAAVVARHGEAIPALRRGLELALIPTLAMFVIAHAVNWGRGWHAMKLKHKSMEQERAMLAFINVVPPDPEWMKSRLTRKSSFSMANYLESKERLSGVTFAPDNRVASFKRGQKVSSNWARFEKPTPLDASHWSLRGTGGLSASDAADLILITAEAAGAEEKIIAFSAPFLPDAFFERESQTRRHVEHYMGWKSTLPITALPPGMVTLRAYVFEQKGLVLRPIEGVHEVEGPADISAR